MLRLSSRSRGNARPSYVCATCLASLAHRGALASAPPWSSIRARHLASAPVRYASTTKQLRQGERGGAEISETPGSGPAELETNRSDSGIDAGSRSHPNPLQPTSLKHALNQLRTALENDQKSASSAEPAARTPETLGSIPDSEPASLAPASEKKRKRKKKSKESEPLNILSVESSDLALTPVVKRQPPVPKLSYGLDRVLFNPGVYHLQDPRSRVYNFDPYLAAIMPIKEFDFNALKQYVTSSKDTTLTGIAAQNAKKYSGSTSSMTSMLAHFHFLLSAWRPVNPAHVSRDFTVDSTNFTKITRAPAAIFLHWKDGTYAIDADKEFDSANILSMLGKSMEKLLTLSKQDFEKYRRTNSDQLTEEERNGPESYHYTTMGDFMMRSQLDAYDRRLPGTGMFDLKTRAVVSIRMDAKDFHKGLGYEIRQRFGQWESYEREYYDMVRSAFLKYSLQVRMGRMDGIFVAFHNTQRIFGFQYIPLPEMDLALHGTDHTYLGDREFKLSLHLLNKVLDKATTKWPEQSLQIHFETRPSDPPFMYIFARPVTQGEIESVQTKNRAQVEKFEREMMGIIHQEEERAAENEVADEEDGLGEAAEEPVNQEDTSLDVWEDMMEKVEETLENDELGINSVREAIEDALEHSGLLQAESTEETRYYLDALVEALTSEVRESEPAADDPAKDSPAREMDERGASSAGAPGAAEPARQDCSSADGSKDRVVAVERPVDGSREAGQATGATDESSPAGENEPSLKDLIVRLAATFQATPEERRRMEADADTDSDSPDSIKPRKFAKLLSELMQKSPEPSVTGSQGQAQPAAESRSASEPPPAQDRPISAEKSTDQGSSPAEEELLAMVLTIRNKVDGKYVNRPEKLSKTSSWTVEYSIEELPGERAVKLYESALTRRRKALQPIDGDNSWYNMFRGQLEAYSRKGRLFRERENKKAKGHPVRVYGMSQELNWSDVFTDEGGPVVPTSLRHTVSKLFRRQAAKSPRKHGGASPGRGRKPPPATGEAAPDAAPKEPQASG